MFQLQHNFAVKDSTWWMYRDGNKRWRSKGKCEKQLGLSVSSEISQSELSHTHTQRRTPQTQSLRGVKAVQPCRDTYLMLVAKRHRQRKHKSNQMCLEGARERTNTVTFQKATPHKITSLYLVPLCSTYIPCKVQAPIWVENWSSSEVDGSWHVLLHIFCTLSCPAASPPKQFSQAVCHFILGCNS